MFKSWLYICKTFKMCLFVFLFVWNIRYWSTTQRKIAYLLRLPKTGSRSRKSFFWNQWNYLLICTADLADSVAAFPSFDKQSFWKRKESLFVVSTTVLSMIPISTRTCVLDLCAGLFHMEIVHCRLLWRALPHGTSFLPFFRRQQESKWQHT